MDGIVRMGDFQSETTILDRHFSVQELASAWNLSEKSVRRMFENEPGVFRPLESAETRFCRGYCTLRIPQTVAERVYLRSTRAAA